LRKSLQLLGTVGIHRKHSIGFCDLSIVLGDTDVSSRIGSRDRGEGKSSSGLMGSRRQWASYSCPSDFGINSVVGGSGTAFERSISAFSYCMLMRVHSNLKFI